MSEHIGYAGRGSETGKSDKKKAVVEGSITFKANFRPDSDGSKKETTEKKIQSRETILDAFYPESGGDEMLARRMALEMLMDGSDVTWQALADSAMQNAVTKQALLDVVRDYCVVMRSISSDASRKKAKCLQDFKMLMQNLSQTH